MRRLRDCSLLQLHHHGYAVPPPLAQGRHGLLQAPLWRDAQHLRGHVDAVDRGIVVFSYYFLVYENLKDS